MRIEFKTVVWTDKKCGWSLDGYHKQAFLKDREQRHTALLAVVDGVVWPSETTKWAIRGGCGCGSCMCCKVKRAYENWRVPS